MGAALSNPMSVNAEILFFRDKNLPLLIELPLQQNGSSWTGVIEQVDSTSQLCLLWFLSGVDVDDNHGRLWPVLLVDHDGRPVEGAHLRMASLLLNSGFPDFRMTKSQDSARAEAMEELRLYPSSWKAREMLWDIAFRTAPGEETISRIKNELNDVFNKSGHDEAIVATLVDFFDRTGQRSKAAEIRRAMVSAYPRGSIAERSRQELIFAERDPSRRADLLEQFLTDFPLQGPRIEEYHTKLALLYLETGSLSKLDTLLNLPGISPGTYYDIAFAMMRDDDKVEKAAAHAGKAVRLLQIQGPASKPPYMSLARWEELHRKSLGMALDLFAEGLTRTGKAALAEKALTEAYELTGGQVDRINEHLAATLLLNGKGRDVLKVCSASVQRGAFTDSLMVLFRNAYLQEVGTDRGFEEYVNISRDIARSAVRQKYLRDRLGIPGGDFLLKGLDGKRIRLSSLTGKVVVLEFWATWCEPCESSFPYLQHVYEKYRGNENVRILALNVWERVSGPEREMLARDFVDHRHVTIPVLLDESYAEQNGVDGLPTIFVVDRKGKIQFKTVGFGDGEQMVEELKQQIELLINEP